MYPYQEKIFLNTSENAIYNKSRQIGISDAYGCRSFLRSYLLGYPILIVSPSQRQSVHFMSYVKKYKRLFGMEIGEEIIAKKDTEMTLIFDGNSEIYSLPNQANTVRGFPANEIIFDEFAHFLHGTDKAVMEAIEPSLSHGGELTLISTPFGTENKYHMIWTDEGVYDDYERVIINWTECPRLDSKRILKMKMRDQLTYEQEYNNQFLEDVDEAEFNFGLIKQCIDMELEYESLGKNKIYLVGVDIGRKRDLTAISFFEKVNKQYILRKVETFFNKKFRWQENYMRDLLKSYTFERFTIDSTGLGSQLAENLHEDFGDTVLPVDFDNEKKQVMVLGLKDLMHEGKLIIPNDPKVINNIRAIKRNYTAGGSLKFDSDRTSDLGHADLFWSIALAMYTPEVGCADFYLE